MSRSNRDGSGGIKQDLENHSADNALHLFKTNYPDLMNWNNISLATFLNTNGITSANSGYWTTDYIPALPNTNYFCSKEGSTVYLGVVVFYNAAKVKIGNLSNVATFTTPIGTRYIRIARQYFSALGTGSSAGITVTNVDSDYIIKKAILQIASSAQAQGYYYLDNKTKIPGHWYSKKWTSYGDSITEMGFWQPYVASELGLIHTNKGLGGTNVAGTYVTIEDVDKYAMNTDERINTIPVDTEMITILGGSNDWSNSIALGTISDTTADTFYGAYQIMLDKLYTLIPNSKIVLLIPPFRKDMVANSLGLVLEDYREAIREISYKYGYQVIDLKANAGINQSNATSFLSDVVHPNINGGKRIAEVVIGGLKSVTPII